MPVGAILVRSDREAQTVLAGVKGRYRRMNRNVITLIIGVLAIAIVVLGYQLYQERHQKSGVDISIGDRGISIEKK